MNVTDLERLSEMFNDEVSRGIGVASLRELSFLLYIALVGPISGVTPI